MKFRGDSEGSAWPACGLRHGPENVRSQRGKRTSDRPLARPGLQGSRARLQLRRPERTGAERPKDADPRNGPKIARKESNRGKKKKKTHFRRRLSCTMHSTLSHRQFPHGAPSTTSHRTLRARHETQALAARLLVTFAGAPGSPPLPARFLGAAAFAGAGLGGLIVVAAGAMVSGLAVAGARTGGVGIRDGLLCVDIFLVLDSVSAERN